MVVVDADAACSLYNMNTDNEENALQELANIPADPPVMRTICSRCEYDNTICIDNYVLLFTSA